MGKITVNTDKQTLKQLQNVKKQGCNKCQSFSPRLTALSKYPTICFFIRLKTKKKKTKTKKKNKRATPK